MHEKGTKEHFLEHMFHVIISTRYFIQKVVKLKVINSNHFIVTCVTRGII